MLRHLKNINELALYAGLSCATAFMVRLNPAFFFPVLLARLAILAYCWYVITNVEQNRVFGAVLGVSILIGWFGGYWDLIEVHLNYKLQEIITNLTLIIAVIIVTFGFYLQWNHGRSQTKN